MPFSSALFVKMNGEACYAEVDESNSEFLQRRRRPLIVFHAIANVTRPIEIVEVHRKLRKQGFWPEVVELEIIKSGGPFLFKKAIATGGAKVFPHVLPKDSVVSAGDLRRVSSPHKMAGSHHSSA